MSLASILDSSSGDKMKEGVSEERVEKALPGIRDLISFYRKYPDIFVDNIKGPGCTFEFYTYQRIFLRQVMRVKYTYAVYPRAFSKSFLTMLSLMLKAILYPGSELFVTTGGKI